MIFKAVIVALAVTVSACGTVVPTIPTKTFNDKVGIAIQTVTVTREAATALLKSKKMTLAQDRTVQANLDRVRLGIQSVQAMHEANPVLAEAQLAQIESDLDGVKADVAKGVTK